MKEAITMLDLPYFTRLGWAAILAAAFGAGLGIGVWLMIWLRSMGL